MDLEQIKNAADEQVNQKTKYQQLAKEIHQELKELYKMMDVFSNALRQKMKAYMEAFFTDAITYFSENEFIVKRQNPTELVEEGTELIANYNGLAICFKEINYKGEPIIITVGDEVRHFQFGIPKEKPNYYGWLASVDIGGTRLQPLGNDTEAVYQHFVNEETCLDELYVVRKEIDEDQGIFYRGMRELEYANLIIYNHDKSQTFQNFKEFWEAL